MASSVSGFLLLFTLMSLLVGLMSQYYKAYLEFDNKPSIIKPIYDKHADSISICATFCGFGCKCFNFNLQTGMCRTYNSCNALYMTVNETGWRLYVDPPLNTKGKHLVFHILQHLCSQCVLFYLIVFICILYVHYVNYSHWNLYVRVISPIFDYDEIINCIFITCMRYATFELCLKTGTRNFCANILIFHYFLTRSQYIIFTLIKSDSILFLQKLSVI